MSDVGRRGGRAPIAVFAYDRVDKLSNMMSTLEACRGFSESPIFIYVDGPKGAADRASVDSVRRLVDGLRSPNISSFFRNENLGLRRSIFAGVTEVVRKYGRVVVLEDDLVLAPIALDYFNNALDRYESMHRVWSVAGYMYDVSALRNREATLALPFAHPWGWATWLRAWQQFALDNRPTERQLNSGSFRAAFDMDGLYPFTAQLRNSIEGRVDSWFIHWYYTIFQCGGVSIFPPRRVLDNFEIGRAHV